MESKNTHFIEEDPDILQVIPNKEINNLKHLYKVDWPAHVHIYNFLDTCMRWKQDKRHANYVTLYSVNGDWSDGTMITVIELHGHDILVYSLNTNLIRLQEGLRKTKKIQWERQITFRCIRVEFKELLWNTKKHINHPFLFDNPSYIWWLPKEKALQYKWSIPPHYYLDALKPTHADILNERWPLKYPGSEKYVEKLIEINGGVGLFSKENGELHAWVMKSYFGGLGILQVAEQQKNKGLGSLITKIYTKMLAEQGLDVIGCIWNRNFVSQKMFSNLGFEKIIATTCISDFQ